MRIQQSRIARSGCVLAAILVVTVLLVVGVGDGRSRSADLICAGKLKDLASTFAIYGAQLEGFPFATSSEAIGALIANDLVQVEQTFCKDNPSQIVLRFPDRIDSDTVVAFEPLGDDRERACVAFADGHARCMTVDELVQLMASVPNTVIDP